jgi:hypothetical protein
LIRVIGIDQNKNIRDLGIEEGTIESVTRTLKELGFKIISIQEEK